MLGEVRSKERKDERMKPFIHPLIRSLFALFTVNGPRLS